MILTTHRMPTTAQTLAATAQMLVACRIAAGQVKDWGYAPGDALHLGSFHQLPNPRSGPNVRLGVRHGLLKPTGDSCTKPGSAQTLAPVALGSSPKATDGQSRIAWPSQPRQSKPELALVECEAQAAKA